MTNGSRFGLAIALLATALGGCSKSNDSEEAPEGRIEETAIEPSEPPPVVPATTPRATASPPAGPNIAITEDDAPPPPPDEQMLDDAAATGMTARATRDEPVTTDTLPAETGTANAQ